MTAETPAELAAECKRLAVWLAKAAADASIDWDCPSDAASHAALGRAFKEIGSAIDRLAALASAAQEEAVAEVYTMEALVPGGQVRRHVSLLKSLPAGTKLYARPVAAATQQAPATVLARPHGTAHTAPTRTEPTAPARPSSDQTGQPEEGS